MLANFCIFSVFYLKFNFWNLKFIKIEFYKLKIYNFLFKILIIDFFDPCSKSHQLSWFNPRWGARRKSALIMATWVAHGGRAPPLHRVWHHCLRSGSCDQDPIQSLHGLIRVRFGVWIILLYGLDNMNRALSSVCTVWSKTFPESGKSGQNQEFRPKNALAPKKERRYS